MSALMAVTLSKTSKAKPLGSILIQCRVKPGVNKIREGVNSVTDYVVELNVAAPAREGEANKAVIRVMSDALDIPKSELSITSGLKSRDKTVEINPSAMRLSQNKDTEAWPALVRERLAKHVTEST